MSLQSSFLLLLSLGFMVLGTSSLPTNDSASKLPETADIVEPILPSNASLTALDVPAGFKVDCDGEKYGYNPNIRDCEAAKEDLKPSSDMWTLGERNTGLGPDVVPLPFRLMGPRGICYVEPVLIEDYVTGKVSINIMRQAAQAIILTCVVSGDSRGGIATGIGGDNHLAVTVGTYEHPISCYGSLHWWTSCREVIYSMPADKEERVFGPRGDPTVTRGLPIRINSVDEKCTANLFSVGKPDKSSYYDIWQGVNAAFSVCIRHGKFGGVKGIGENGDIFVTMTTRDRLQLASNSSGGTSA